MSADLLVAETRDDLEVPLGLVQREPGEDLGRGGRSTLDFTDVCWSSAFAIGFCRWQI